MKTPNPAPPKPSASLQRRVGLIYAQLDQMDSMLDQRDIEKVAPSVSNWSIGEQIDHNGLTTALIAGTMPTALADPPPNVDGRPIPLGRVVLWTGYIPRGKGKAPAPIIPQKRSLEEVRASLDTARDRMDDVKARLGEYEATKGRAPHPVLGMFTPVQWIRFIEIHNLHHLKIIRDIERAK